MASPGLSYTPSVYGAEPVQMAGPATFVGTGAALRGRKWEYTLGARGISAQARRAREVSVDAAFLDPAEADRLRRAADIDVSRGRPGTLTYGGEWTQAAYITAADPGTIRGRYHTATLTVVLLDGVWRRAHTVEVRPRTDGEASEFLDMGFDAPFDLSPSARQVSLATAQYAESPVKLVIYGPATNPYVIIGGNRYQVDVTVQAGARLVVDGASWPRTIELVGADGSRTDCFAAGHRGSGEGGGEYVFQPLPAGSPEVAWPGSFGFDIVWYEQEGEPPWSSS